MRDDTRDFPGGNRPPDLPARQHPILPGFGGPKTRGCVLCPGLFVPDSVKSRQELCGECLKRAGIKAATENQARTAMVRLMRNAAAAVAVAEHRAVTIEDAYRRVEIEHRIRFRDIVNIIGPAAGGVFIRSRWRFTGQRVRATLNANNHAREIKVWALR